MANRDVKVLVVGNPVNTNAYIAMCSAPDLPAKNFTAMMRLDHNRALSQLAIKLQKSVSDIRQLIVWGNHSAVMYPDIRFVQITNTTDVNTFDNTWIQNKFIPSVSKRGAEIINTRGASSAASAASAAIDHIHDWINGSNGNWVTMGVPSDGSYGIPEGIMYGFPVITYNGQYEIVRNLEIDQFSRDFIDANLQELLKERDNVAQILKTL